MTLSIDIVSDVVCPWCFIGKRRLEAALDLEAPIENPCEFFLGEKPVVERLDDGLDVGGDDAAIERFRPGDIGLAQTEQRQSAPSALGIETKLFAISIGHRTPGGVPAQRLKYSRNSQALTAGAPRVIMLCSSCVFAQEPSS